MRRPCGSVEEAPPRVSHHHPLRHRRRLPRRPAGARAGPGQAGPRQPPDKPDAKKARRRRKSTPNTSANPKPSPTSGRRFSLSWKSASPNIAARLLHEMMKKATDDKELVALEQKVGTTAFLRLQTTFLRYQTLDRESAPIRSSSSRACRTPRSWPARVNKALETVLGDRATILKHIKEPQRRPRGPRLRRRDSFTTRGRWPCPPSSANCNRPRGRSATRSRRCCPALAAETVPPLIAALDIDDTNLRLDLIEVLRQRNAKEAVPFLRYFAGSPKVPERVRAAAKDAIAYLTETQPARLTPAPIALTREAERYYRHQVPLGTAGEVLVWRWDDKAKQLVKGLPGAAQRDAQPGGGILRPALRPAGARHRPGLRPGPAGAAVAGAGQGGGAGRRRGQAAARPTCASCSPRSIPIW